MSAFHATPRPETVADVWDNCGSHCAYERWGYLGQEAVARFARAGRIAAGRAPVVGDLQHLGAGGESLLDRGWDGAPPIGAVAAASALGLPLSTLQDA